MRPKKAVKSESSSKPWYIFVLASLLILISLSVLIDHFTAREEEITIESMDIYEVKSKGKYSSYSRTVGYLYELTSTTGLKLEVETKSYMIEEYDKLVVEYTPLYKLVHGLKIKRGETLSDQSPQEGIFILLLVVSLAIILISVIAMIVKSNDVAIKLLIMNVFFLGGLYYMFGNPNYFLS